MKNVFWVALATVLGFATVANGQFCCESNGIVEVAPVMHMESVDFEAFPVTFESAPMYVEEPVTIEGMEYSGFELGTPVMEYPTMVFGNEIVLENEVVVEEPMVFGETFLGESVEEVYHGETFVAPMIENFNGCCCYTWEAYPTQDFGEVIYFGDPVDYMFEGEVTDAVEATFTSTIVEDYEPATDEGTFDDDEIDAVEDENEDLSDDEELDEENDE